MSSRKRAELPDRAFAYIDSRGRRRLPIHDEAHVRNALSRFNQVVFESEEAKERAQKKLLSAAKKYGIVPVGFMTGQLRSQSSEAAAGRLVIDLDGVTSAAALEARLQRELRDPTLVMLQWSESAAAYLDCKGRAVPSPDDGADRSVTRLDRHGQPMLLLVHDPAVLNEPALVKRVTAAIRLKVENERLRGLIDARSTEMHTLPTGSVTFLLSDIEGSTALLHDLGDRYAALLAEVRAIIRGAVQRSDGREVDARADEFFAVFARGSAALEAALAVTRTLQDRTWPHRAEVRVRIGIHSGRPALTDTGYVGLAVHTAARISSAAHGGQILLSAAACRAVGKARPAGIRFRSIGSHRLRGLRARQTLFQVVARDLTARFPPPRIG